MPERRLAPLRRRAQRYLVGGGVTARGRRGGRRRGRVSKFDEGNRGGIPRLVKASLGALRPGDARALPRAVYHRRVRAGHRHVRAEQPRNRGGFAHRGLLFGDGRQVRG